MTFSELYKMHKQSLMRLESPKYKPWEIKARAYIRAHINVKMGMNFNQKVEEAFVMGVKYANKYNPRKKV